MFFEADLKLSFTQHLCEWSCENVTLCNPRYFHSFTMSITWLPFVSLKSRSPDSADVHPSSLMNLSTPTVAVSGSQNLSLGCWTHKLSPSGSHDSNSSCKAVLVILCFSFSTQALWLPSKNRSLLPSSLHLLSHWLCHSSYERRGCHWSVSITGSSMGIQVRGPTRTFGKVMFLTKLE